jgi:SpoVK/Ycf46/Vps4 family AAA+-type ATPase
MAGEEEEEAEDVIVSEEGVVDEASERKASGAFRTAQLKAFVTTLLSLSQFWRALLICVGFLSFALLFPMYSFLVIPLLLIIFVVSYHSPVLGTVLSFVLILPSVSYQTPALGWIYLVPVAIMLFEVFKNWYLISAILAVISVPFTPEPFNIFLGALIVPILTLSALRMGSRKTAFVVPIVIYVILLLSALWGRPTLFLTVNDVNYAQASLLVPTKMAPDLSGVPTAAADGILSLGSFDTFTDVSLGLGIMADTTLRLFIEDAGFFQIIAWSLVFYGIAWLPLMFGGGKFNQFFPSLLVLVLIPVNFAAAFLSNVPFDYVIIPVALGTVALTWLMDHWGIEMAREEEIVSEEKKGKFLIGVTDLSTAKAGPASLSDVGNYDSTKKEIQDAIMMPIKYKELSVAYGIHPPKGILLFGPPGCGKTLLMSALAKEMRMGFYYVKCSEIMSQWYGESEKNVTELFKIARENAPCVLFIDEIDSIGKKREAYEADETTPRILSAMLQEMDGMKGDDRVIVVAATNVPNMLDTALLRPGRFDKIIYMPVPDEKGREAILRLYTKSLPLGPDVNMKKLAKSTERFTGADIANLVLEAARQAAPEAIEEKKVVPLKMSHFTDVMKSLKSSVTFEMLEDYEKFRMDFERRGVREEIVAPAEERKVTWKDVIGMDYVRDTLKEAIELPLLHEEELQKYKVKPVKGILLFGPPGTGKTLIVKAASNELKASFVTLSPADISRVGYERAVRLVKETFNRARENAPSVVFIDEIESLAPSRAFYPSKLSEDIVSQLLQELDGLKELKNVVVIGATNRPDILDTALLRPGRFDKIVFVRPPNKQEREEMFKLNLQDVKGADRLEYGELAEKSEGFTGADIAAVCQDAKMKLIRRKIAGEEEPAITQEAVSEVMRGRKPSVTVKMLEDYLKFVKEYGERR